MTGPTAGRHTPFAHGVGVHHTQDGAGAPYPRTGARSDGPGMAFWHVTAVAFAGLRHMAAIAVRP